MSKTFLSTLVIASLIILPLVACSSEPAKDTTSATVKITAANTPTPAALTMVPATTNPPNSPIVTLVTTHEPTNPPNLTPTPFPTSNLQYNWLRGIHCSPPCFEGITPGKTTADEAVNILKKSPRISLVTKDNFDGNGGSIRWNWVNQPLSASGHIGDGSVLYYRNDATGQLIYRISPNFGQTSIKLGELIQAFGEPTHIVANSVLQEKGGDSFPVNIIYLNKGFVMRTYGYSKTSGKPVINSDRVLEDGLDFFEPGFEGITKFYSISSKEMVPWQGFKDFDFYCREYNGSPCIFHT